MSITGAISQFEFLMAPTPPFLHSCWCLRSSSILFNSIELSEDSAPSFSISYPSLSPNCEPPANSLVLFKYGTQQGHILPVLATWRRSSSCFRNSSTCQQAVLFRSNSPFPLHMPRCFVSALVYGEPQNSASARYSDIGFSLYCSYSYSILRLLFFPLTGRKQMKKSRREKRG